MEEMDDIKAYKKSKKKSDWVPFEEAFAAIENKKNKFQDCH
jgi:hypothetical protein